MMRNKGFTLLEVMVASLILFSAIAVATVVYRGAYSASIKANNHLNLAGVVPIVLKKVQVDLRAKAQQQNETLTGKGSVLNNQYTWTATLLSFQAAPERYDSGEDQFVNPAARFKLWQVDLNLKKGSSQQHYQYRELSWDDE